MKLRVAFISVVPSPYQRDLFHALSQQPEIDLEVAYLEASAPDSPWPEKPLAPYESILPGFWFPLGKARCHWNWRLPNPRHFDVVVMNSLMSLTAQWMMRFALRGQRWMFWGELLGQGGKLHDALATPLHAARAIAAIGSRAQRDYAGRFPEPRSACIPYYCDLAPFSAAPRHERAAGEVTFLLCGQMIARKGVDLLLQAIARLPAARLLLVGREAELPALLEALDPAARARVEYAGFHAPEDLPPFFAKADAFVLPSRYDGWGVVVNQALGAGLPIVCSDAVGAAHDLIDEGVNGHTFRSGDVDSLTAALRQFIDGPEIIGRWGEASREKAQQWTPEIGARKWVHLIQEVCAA